MAQPFAGIRVVDFTQVLAGPFATQQLAQHGAEVIKVEPPGMGDMTRNLMAGKKGSPSFYTCNIGKKSLTLDMKGVAAAPILQRLIPTADVFIQGFRPGVMQRLGYGYEAVRALREDIIYASVSGFGQSGPSSHLPAFDGAIQASSGMMAINGHPQTGPTRTGYMPVDMATALNTAFAVSAALYRRLATGEGQAVDVAMMDTAMVLQAPQMSAYMVNGVQPELLGNRSPTKAPTANVFATADGFVQVVAIKEAQVEALFEVLGLQERYPEFAQASVRIEQTQALNDLMNPIFQNHTTQHWLDTFEAAGVPVASIRDFAAVAEDAQLATRPVFAETDLGDGTLARVVSAAHTTSTDQPVVQGPAPDLGGDTDSILRELDFSSSQIADWREAGAI